MAQKLSELLEGINLNTADGQALAKALNAQQNITVRSDDQLRAEAARAIDPLYNQKTLSAQQNYQTTELSLKNQLDKAAASYDAQRQTAAENTVRSVSETDRQMLTRGMGRSSYGLATIGNIRTQGDKMQQQINTSQTNLVNDVNSQIALASRQLADLLASYQTDKEMDIMARMDELRSKDKADAAAAREYNNNLILALADRIREQQNTAWERQMAEREFQARYAPPPAPVYIISKGGGGNRGAGDGVYGGGTGKGGASNITDTGNKPPAITDTTNKPPAITKPPNIVKYTDPYKKPTSSLTQRLRAMTV